MRGKACFTHDMDHFERDVRGKRFSTYGKHGLEIDLETLTEKLTIEWGNKKRNPVLFTKDRTPI